MLRYAEHAIVHAKYAKRYRLGPVARGADKQDLAKKLGADEYIDSDAGDPAKTLMALGGADVVLSTVPSSAAQVQLLGGLKPNGRLILFAHDENPLKFSADYLLFGRKAVVGWYSGRAKDSEETLAFAVLRGVRPMVELFPLEEAERAFQYLGKAFPRCIESLGGTEAEARVFRVISVAAARSAVVSGTFSLAFACPTPDGLSSNPKVN